MRSIPTLVELKSTERADRRERTILVGVILPDSDVTPDDPLDEIRGLAKTAGLTWWAACSRNGQQVDIATYIGSGKVEELKELVEAHEADLVVFDNDLGPAQTRNLEKLLGVKVIDRTEVILDIFATRARTHEAHLQVELAQLEYAMPRLKRMWTHLSRYKGGIGVRGPGEKQLEEDRRLVGHRIQDLKAKLAKVQARKEREVAGRPRRADRLARRLHQRRQEHADERPDRRRRARRGQALRDARHPDPPLAVLGRRPRPALRHGRVHPQPAAHPGRLVQGDARGGPPGRPAAPRRRRVEPRGREADPGRASGPRRAGLADHPTILVLNKADRVPDRSFLDVLRAHHRDSVTISAARGEGLDRLEQAVREALHERALDAEVETGVGNGRVLAYLAQHAQIHDRTYDDDRVLLQCRLPRRCLDFLNEHGARVRPRRERRLRRAERW